MNRGAVHSAAMHPALIAVDVEEPCVALPRPEVLSAAELAECTCPDWCERDHDND
jgi:hypothetical protein